MNRVEYSVTVTHLHLLGGLKNMITVRLDENTQKAFADLCKKQNLSVSTAVRKYIDETIEYGYLPTHDTEPTIEGLLTYLNLPLSTLKQFKHDPFAKFILAHMTMQYKDDYNKYIEQDKKVQGVINDG